MEASRPEYLIAPIPRHPGRMPTLRWIRAQIRARLNHFYTLDRLETRYGHGQMELAQFNPPERKDGSVWPGDGGKPPAESGQARVNGAKQPVSRRGTSGSA
jgi:hypothetical protein